MFLGVTRKAASKTKDKCKINSNFSNLSKNEGRSALLSSSLLTTLFALSSVHNMGKLLKARSKLAISPSPSSYFAALSWYYMSGIWGEIILASTTTQSRYRYRSTSS